MFLMITVCAVLGGCAAGIVAWWHLRAGRLPNKPQEAASREEANRES